MQLQNSHIREGMRGREAAEQPLRISVKAQDPDRRSANKWNSLSGLASL
jgi:hypothetical protein